MLADGLVVAAGLLVLVAGGELLVRGAVGLAYLLRISPAVIGLTIVAFATSMPELVVSVVAAIRGSPDLAIGNVMGSNIFNVGFVLGVTALFVALPVPAKSLMLEWPFLLAATLLTLGIMANGLLGRVEGGILLLLLVAFVWVLVRASRKEVRESEAQGLTVVAATFRRTAINGAFLAGGLGLLLLGAHWVVQGATSIALDLGISERVVGLTVVAMGTSLPELASSLVAAVRGRTDIAVGNVIGSCIFNLFGIFGVGALLSPMVVNPAFFEAHGLRSVGDAWWMLFFTLLLAPLVLFGKRQVGRGDGVILVAAFSVYMVQLVLQGGGS